MEGLAALVDPTLTKDDLLALVLKTGQMGVETMALKEKIIDAVKSGASSVSWSWPVAMAVIRPTPPMKQRKNTTLHLN